MGRVLIVLGCLVLPGRAQDWKSWGNDPGGSRFSPLTQINRESVARLQRAWVYHTGEVKPGTMNSADHHVDAFEATPLMVDGVLYFSTPSSRVIALDPQTGRELWKFDPQADKGIFRTLHPHRGVSYWQSEDGRDRRIIYGTFEAGLASRLIALNARTGRPCPDFGVHGSVDLRAGIADKWPDVVYAVTSPPAIYKNLAIVGAEVPEYPSEGPTGDVRAFDVRSGKLVWTFHTLLHRDKLGPDSSTSRTGANVWSIMSVDVTRGMVFLPVGSASYDFYGADRKGAGLYANSLVALDAATGRVIWHYQMVHHDIWDYDLPAQPVLINVNREGHDIPAVAQVTKMSFVFILDRVTGKPLYPVEERAVLPSQVPGEAAWPTQPFPLKPPALSRQSFKAKDLSTVTPESNRYCTELWRTLSNHGLFAPYGLKGTLVAPGTFGGGTWSGGAFEPSTGRLFVNTNELFAIGKLAPQPEGSPERYRRTSKTGEYAFFWDPNQWPCQQPPWGNMSAIDVNSGSIVWKVPLGRVDALKDSLKVDSGTPNLGGSIVTAGGLLFVGATTDARFRALDSATGQQLWMMELDAPAHAMPMTYLGKNGKQYVVIAAGGGGVFYGKTSDSLVAFTLPK